MSKRIEPADQAVAYFATEPLDSARATLNQCMAVVKAREKKEGGRAVRKRASAGAAAGTAAASSGS